MCAASKNQYFAFDNTKFAQQLTIILVPEKPRWWEWKFEYKLPRLLLALKASPAVVSSRYERKRTRTLINSSENCWALEDAVEVIKQVHSGLQAIHEWNRFRMALLIAGNFLNNIRPASSYLVLVLIRPLIRLLLLSLCFHLSFNKNRRARFMNVSSSRLAGDWRVVCECDWLGDCSRRMRLDT